MKNCIRCHTELVEAHSAKLYCKLCRIERDRELAAKYRKNIEKQTVNRWFKNYEQRLAQKYQGREHLFEVI